MKTNLDEVIGQKYGKLTILSAERMDGYVMCRCQCECGHIKDVRLGNLRTGHTKTCGNHSKEFVHRTHGMSKTRLDRIYRKMRNRCNNPNDDAYKHYGLRGITVCDEWLSHPESFFEWALSNGYSDNLTIDRIDNAGNYEPTNCRWITMKEQCENRSSNRLLTFRGETKTVTQWAEHFNIKSSLIFDRLDRGWSVEDALLLPKI
jgi:hypothetical protein